MPITRLEAQTCLDYIERVTTEGDTTPPERAGLTALSTVLNESAMRIYNDYMGVLCTSDDHIRRVSVLRNARPAGPYCANKRIFDNVTPMEQMASLASYLGTTNINTIHTFFFKTAGSSEKDRILVKAKESNLMHVMLGDNRSAYKAPHYSTWEDESPLEDRIQTLFIRPLEALEIVRQPNFVAATLLKGNAFEKKRINSKWRYGSEYACVEDRGQSRISRKKKESAGLNEAAFVKAFANSIDTDARETNICLPLRYEQFSDEGYRDGWSVDVSPGNLLRGVKQVIRNSDATDLDRLMRQLFVAKFGPPSTPELKTHLLRQLS